MERVLILGNRGMLGHVLFQVLNQQQNLDVYGINRNNSGKKIYNVDLEDLTQLENIIRLITPKYVINCVGKLVQDSNDYPINAININSLLPHRLKEFGEKYDFKLIHISTDCVFNGLDGPYSENDHKTETNYYGVTKSLGEINDNTNLTIRTSIIGPELKEGTGLFHWVMNKSKGKNHFIEGYSNVYWSGLTTLELSKFIRFLIVTKSKLTGIIHASNGCCISKYELIQRLKEIFNLDLTITENKEHNKNKCLINNKCDYPFNDYNRQIIELKEFITNHGDLYKY